MTSTGDVPNYLTERFNGVSISGCSIRNEFLHLPDVDSPGKLDVSFVMVLLDALDVLLGPNHFYQWDISKIVIVVRVHRCS